jgi:hypothetical protein
MICEVTHDGKLVKRLINEWHSTLKAIVGWRVAFALIFDEKIMGISTWGHPTATKEDQVNTLEHSRMALGPGLPKNTASWFLARNREWIRANMPEIKRLITYVNLEHHKGTIYQADNWKLIYKKRVWTSWNNRPGRKPYNVRFRAKFERVP